MEKIIRNIITCIWVFFMFSPIIAYRFFDAPLTQIDAINYTFTSFFALGSIGYLMYNTYMFTKNYSNYKWKKSDF